jgi:hypothetical protein
MEDLDPTGLAPFIAQLAKAADLCLKPYRHGVRLHGPTPEPLVDCSDCCFLIEARDAEGVRQELHDFELEIYRSGAELNLMLSRRADELAPLLWHGSHAVWMRAESGERCECPENGAALEALCRRIRALVAGD